MSDATLLEETLDVLSVLQDKYDRVSRIAFSSDDKSLAGTVDINTEIYPISDGERLSIQLASTLDLTGQTKEAEKGSAGWNENNDEASLADMYDYVCYGKVYRFEEGEGDNVKVFISFGGLLMLLEGSYKRLRPLRIDYIYLLMKK